jgi:hypothetical protein
VLFFGVSDLADEFVVEGLAFKEVCERQAEYGQDVFRLAAVRHTLDEDSLAPFGDGERWLTVRMGGTSRLPLPLTDSPGVEKTCEFGCGHASSSGLNVGFDEDFRCFDVNCIAVHAKSAGTSRGFDRKGNYGNHILDSRCRF